MKKLINLAFAKNLLVYLTEDELNTWSELFDIDRAKFIEHGTDYLEVIFETHKLLMTKLSDGSAISMTKIEGSHLECWLFDDTSDKLRVMENMMFHDYIIIFNHLIRSSSKVVRDAIKDKFDFTHRPVDRCDVYHNAIRDREIEFYEDGYSDYPCYEFFKSLKKTYSNEVIINSNIVNFEGDRCTRVSYPLTLESEVMHRLTELK